MKANYLLRVGPILTDLAACLCAGLQAEGQTPTCFCGVVMGNTVLNDAFSECDDMDGYASVRLAAAYPCETTGEASTRRDNLKLGLGCDIELSIQRTLLLDTTDLTVSVEQHAAMVAQEILDMKTLFQAVGCCQALADAEVIVGTWTPVGPAGLAYGGVLPIFVSVP